MKRLITVALLLILISSWGCGRAAVEAPDNPAPPPSPEEFRAGPGDDASSND